jgi:hypothetical protein
MEQRRKNSAAIRWEHEPNESESHEDIHDIIAQRAQKAGEKALKKAKDAVARFQEGQRDAEED